MWDVERFTVDGVVSEYILELAVGLVDHHSTITITVSNVKSA